MEIKNVFKASLKASVLLFIAGSMMGNEGCKKEVKEPRSLRRRVQMGVIDAPVMPLPNGQVFDFKFVANSQLYYVLRKTKSFSSATIGTTDELDPAKMNEAEKDMFYQCQDSEGLAPFKMSQEAACMIRMPQAKINGAIESFELETAGGVTVGLPQFMNLGFSADIKSSRLTMNFKADDPLIKNKNIAATRPNAKQIELKVGAKVNFGEFALGADYYYRDPLGKVVNQAMIKGIEGLKTQFDAAQEWYGMVLKNCDTKLLINAGNATDAGLVKGDQLAVYNVWYDWEGRPCDSNLYGSMPASTEPIAVIEVEIAGDTFSQAKILSQTGDRIKPGARVVVRKLYEPPQSKPKK